MACVPSPLRSPFFINRKLNGYNPLQPATTTPDILPCFICFKLRQSTDYTWHTAIFPYSRSYNWLRFAPGKMPKFHAGRLTTSYDAWQPQQKKGQNQTGESYAWLRHIRDIVKALKLAIETSRNSCELAYEGRGVSSCQKAKASNRPGRGCDQLRHATTKKRTPEKSRNRS
jgi:hypothetical protein